MIDKEIAEQLYDPKKVPHSLSRPPRRWFYAMLKGIKRGSDVRDPAAIVGSIWKRLSPIKRAQIKARELKGEQFRYDLPLPKDYPTRGVGTVRTVDPFKLAEVQINVGPEVFARLIRSRLFKTMRRNDGSVALVKRCKSPKGNCNIFIDRR